MQFLKLSIESHDRQIGDLTDRLAAQSENIDKLGAKIDKIAEITHDLVRIAMRHEERLDNGGL